ncbi:MAG: tRNA (adenosine(37)-N6)-threonylcarbamoyltransferase complex dimerization subunit type 1 TsaB [Rhodospirillales bacterium]
MRVLALDTAMTACSSALWRDGEVCARRFEMMERGQSEALIPMVREVMDEAGCGFPDIDLLAVTVGPGAFTGLRIGLSAARGMALACGLPCLGVTTLEAVANGVERDERAARTLLVALDSKRDDVYAQAFDENLAALGQPSALAADGLGAMALSGPLLVAGNAAEKAAEALSRSGFEVAISAASGVPDAAVAAAIAAVRWRPGDELSPPEPLYLRPPDVTVAKQLGRC